MMFIGGGAGFIGSNGVHYFLNRGEGVIVYDNGGKVTILKGDVKSNREPKWVVYELGSIWEDCFICQMWETGGFTEDTGKVVCG